MAVIYGAAHKAVVRKLDRLMVENDYEAFDLTHDLIFEPGRCEKNLHNYCGCEIHQAWCPCLMDDREPDDA